MKETYLTQYIPDAIAILPLLEYGMKDLVPDPWFNLYNNIWNTNFPMWFGENVRFRFLTRRR